MNALQEKAGLLDQKRAEWRTLYDAHKEKMDHPLDVVEKMGALNDEMTDLGKEVDRLQAMQDQAAQIKAAQDRDNTPIDRIGHATTNDRPTNGEIKSPGRQFIESKSYESFKADTRVQGKVAAVETSPHEFKATFTTSAASFTMRGQQPGLITIGTQRLTIADLVSQGQTNENTITYFQEDTYTNAATAVAEEGSKPEATFDTSEATAAVRKIAVIGRVTDEFFMDFPALRSYVDDRLVFMVQEREEALVLNGNGTPPNLRGILQTSGIQTYALSNEPVPDAIYRGMLKVRTVGFFEPDGVVLHPNDWADIRLLRTTDGIYIWGSPSEAGPERIWGLNVVQTMAMTQNTGLVGAFKLGATIFRREGIRVETTNSDASDFQFNRIAVRVEERLALAVWRPKAFCTVTGI